MKCKGCHSTHLQCSTGVQLTSDILETYLKKYGNFISCVLFYGGDWKEEKLLNALKLVKSKGLKTALYTGAMEISENLKPFLDYLKVGSYKEELGGLREKTTNQRFYYLPENKDMTYKFQTI
jgi:anaerobic ribonucleoside-triphosphate reductase activating protein